MNAGVRVLMVAAALGCGLNAGVFFAFSAFVMRALRHLPASQGISAAQAINVSAVRPALMTALFGTAIACLTLVVAAVVAWDERTAIRQLVGSILYLIGVVGLTMVRHVPLNDGLATVDPSSAAAAGRWTGYVQTWTRWNHVRAAAALAAAAAFTLALAV